MTVNSNLPQLLKPIHVNLSDLLLDPNNPRFSELGEDINPVPEGRFADERVQLSTFEKMRHDSFDVVELRDTIKSLGFLPMDRIVVRAWKGTTSDGKNKYVVVEGNRRVTALKWLLALHDAGKETFGETQLDNYENIECLLLDDAAAQTSATLILPGLRHVSGVKEWGAYQKAKAVFALRRTGMTPQEVAQSLGLSTRAANSAYRCFLALEQMKAHDEFGEFAEPKMYSYFEEVLKRPNVKTWLGWSDEKECFTSVDRLSEFYSWLVPNPEDGSAPKLPEAKSVRDLSQVIDDENALDSLRAPEGTLSRALARYEVDHPEDWLPKIVAASGAVKSLTPEKLRGMDEAALKVVSQLQQNLERALADRTLLMKPQ